MRPATLLVTLLTIGPATLAAQVRVQERHSRSDSEGKLMSFYSATLTFSPVGPLLPLDKWGIEAGVDVTYVPPLSREQRTAGFDKPEATNLAPIFPRPRAALTLPYAIRAEASWVPPVRVFDIEANIVSVALSRRAATVASVSLVPRIAWTSGRVRGAITCPQDLASGSTTDRIYYASVCHGRESDDYFEPRHFTLELVASRVTRVMGAIPYAGAGWRWDRSRFDIGVIRANGSRDLDHPVLSLRSAQGYGVAGGSWAGPARSRVSAELFYAPGSVLTARVFAGLRLLGDGDAR